MSTKAGQYHEEALVLVRARWQIELLFKLWKQYGHLDEWRSAVPLLASALAGVLPLVRALDHLCRTICRGCRQNPRKTAPHTYQLLLALDPLPTDAPSSLRRHAIC